MEILYTKDPAWLEKWDAFVKTDDRGCHLVLSDWIRSYQSYGFDAEYCLSVEDGKIVGGFAAVITKVLFFKFYLVPYGPLAKDIFPDGLKVLSALVLERAKFHGAAYAHLALPTGDHGNSHFYNGNVSVTGAKHGHHFPYVYSSNGLNWVSLKDFPDEEALLESFKSSVRRDIRSALRKGMAVEMLETEEQVKSGYAICLANAAKHGYALRDWDSFKESLVNLIHKGTAKFIAAYKDGDLKGAILLVKAGNYYTYILGGTKKEKPDLLAGHLLQWEAIRMSMAEKCDGYNISLGGSAGVMEFKNGFGTEHLLFENSRFHWILRPALFNSYRFFEKRMKPYKKRIAKLLSKFRK